MARYKVMVGQDFEVESFDIEEIENVEALSRIARDNAHSRVRVRLTYFLLIGIAVALIASTAIALVYETPEPVRSVWAAAALPLGYILKGFFEKAMPP